MNAQGKADALNRGRAGRGGSAVPLPPEAPAEDAPRTPTTGERRPDGQGRRGHMRKVSMELTPPEHDRFKAWIVATFGGTTAGAAVLRGLLAEAYENPALTERVRRRLQQSRD